MATVAQVNIRRNKLVEEILVRLPVKSLMRFKSVSKQWNLLFSDQNFIKTHKAKTSSLKSHINLFMCRNGAEYTVQINNDFDGSDGLLPTPVRGYSPLRPYDSVQEGAVHCNGLLCVLTERGTVIVWNPCTREDKRFNVYPTTLKDKVGAKGLGFGYVSSTDEYKVVVACKNLLGHVEFHILSLKTGLWKAVVEHNQRWSIWWPYSLAVHFNGCLYWNTIEDYVVCFDLERDVVKIDMRILGEDYITDENVTFRGGRVNPFGFLCFFGSNKFLFKDFLGNALILYDHDSTRKIAIDQSHGNELLWHWSLTPYEETLVRLSVEEEDVLLGMENPSPALRRG